MSISPSVLGISTQSQPPADAQFKKAFPNLTRINLSERPDSADHVDQLTLLFHNALLEHQVTDTPVTSAQIKVATEGVNMPAIRNPKNFFMLYLDQKGRGVGSIAYRAHPTKPVAEITNFFVDSAYQGKGLGRWLRQEAVPRMVAHGVETVLLWTHFLNSSAYYTKLGMQQIGVNEGKYPAFAQKIRHPGTISQDEARQLLQTLFEIIDVRKQDRARYLESQRTFSK
jgi:GNAT superfamily N-acetyltransferase